MYSATMYEESWLQQFFLLWIYMQICLLIIPEYLFLSLEEHNLITCQGKEEGHK